MRISLKLIISVLCSFSEIFTNDIKEKNSKPFEKKNPALWISLSVGKMVKADKKSSWNKANKELKIVKVTNIKRHISYQNLSDKRLSLYLETTFFLEVRTYTWKKKMFSIVCWLFLGQLDSSLSSGNGKHKG